VYISSNSDFKTAANGGYIQNTTTLNGQTVPADLIVTTDTACSSAVTAWEVASYSASTGTVELWVNQGTLSHTVNTVFYLCIGNSAVTTYQSTASNTWNANFVRAYHFANGSGSTLSLLNSTSVSATLTNNGSATSVAGQMDGGIGLASASSQYASSATVPSGTAMSYTAWVQATSFPNSYNAVVDNSTTSGSTYFTIFVKSNGKLACYLTTSGGTVDYDGSGSTTLSTGTWYYVAMTYNSTNGLTGYVNGTVDATAGANGTVSNSANLFVVGQNPPHTPRFWNGPIDEVRVATVALSADWITAEYNMEKPSQTMVTLGSRIAMGGPRGSQIVELHKGVLITGLH
jgi:hypothetical protein